ncbi:MAG: fibronectin type III domain-containing protein [Clostridia bacterium]|nr:fibronectin type III domain-containing protein [Clostridia bacterium]
MKKIGGLVIALFSVLLITAAISPDVKASDSAVKVTDSSNRTLAIYYGDIISLEQFSTVEVSDYGEASSERVGYGVVAEKDYAVIDIIDGKLCAVGVGKASVKLDGISYTVTVEPAPISMFFLIGQSNMSGREGDNTASVACADGQVYSTYAHGDVLTVSNAPYFVPSSLVGESSEVNTKGNNKYLGDYPVNSLTAGGNGKEGPDSGIAYEWNRITGDKVWLVNASQKSTPISKWLKGESEYKQSVALFKSAQKVMAQEIKAGHFILKNYGVFWLQGCADGAKTAEYYYNSFMSMYNSLMTELAYDIDGDGSEDFFEFFNIIMPRAGSESSAGYRKGTYDDTPDVRYYQSFLDLEMRGHRVAQYYICNNPDNNIYLVSNLGDSWVTMPDGSDGVEDYFKSHYKYGRVDYPVQKKQPEKWYYPKTPADVHDNIHYNQVGYNEIGIDAARNAAYTHSRVEKPADIKTTVKFYDWTGYREVTQSVVYTNTGADSLIVPVVYPVYESKNVTYSISDKDITYKFYDLVRTGTVSDGTVIKAEGTDGKFTVELEPELKLSKPSSVDAKAYSDYAILSWSKVKSAAGYRIYMKTSSGWKAVRTTVHTSYTITGLSPDKKYTFCVRAYGYQLGKAVFAGSYSSISFVTSLETPQLRVASTAKKRATLAWYDISGESGYQIWYSSSKNGKYTKLSNYKANTVKVYETGLKSGKTYYFKLRAYKKTANGYSYSDFSDIKALKIK